MTNKRVLVLEGAGWAEADSSKATDLTNCRIRTRFLNNEGKAIYFEANMHNEQLLGSAVHSFSSNCNEHSEWRNNEYKKFDYTKEGLLEFINNNYDCSFESVEVVNDNSIRVHINDGSVRVHNEGGYNILCKSVERPEVA